MWLQREIILDAKKRGFHIVTNEIVSKISEIDDIKAMAKPVLRHRLITSFNAEAEGLSTDDILIKLLEES